MISYKDYLEKTFLLQTQLLSICTTEIAPSELTMLRFQQEYDAAHIQSLLVTAVLRQRLPS
jgi:hypothetical protein